MSLDNIRLSQTARDQLIRLKRFTGIGNWNVLCRWALCASLVEETPPRHQQIPADSSVEMTWKTFGGQHEDVYRALIRKRYVQERDFGFESEIDHFRHHLHRGIGYLAGNRSLKSIADLVGLAVSSEPEPAATK